MIDGGPSEVGVESTVVRVLDGVVCILRPGGVTKEDIESLGFEVRVEKEVMGKFEETSAPLSPGMKYRHYAPNTECVLVYSEDDEKLRG